MASSSNDNLKNQQSSDFQCIVSMPGEIANGNFHLEKPLKKFVKIKDM